MNENAFLAVGVTTLAITIATSAMGTERVLTCLYDNPNFKDKSVNVFVDETKSTVIHDYQNTKGNAERRMKITEIVGEWIYANNSHGLFVINKNNGRWGLSWIGGGVDGMPQGGFVKGICHANPFK
jgi:hypothetical protein